MYIGIYKFKRLSTIAVAAEKITILSYPLPTEIIKIKCHKILNKNLSLKV